MIKKPISILPQAPALQDNFRMELMNPNEPNASKKSVSESLGNLKTYILTGQVTMNGFVWINKPTVTISGTTITVSEGTADIDNVYTVYPLQVFNITLPATGLQRIDVISALENGTYYRTEGDAAQSPVQPAQPANSTYLTLLVVNSTKVEEGNPEQFVRYKNQQLIDPEGNVIPLGEPESAPTFSNQEFSI